MNPRNRRLPATLVISFGVVIGAVLILLISGPRVEAFFPLPGGDSVSSLSRIQIQFNRPMDKLSVESRIQIDPDTKGIFYWDGQSLLFEPAQPWPPDSTVTITLRGGSSGTNRVPMIGQRQWSFNVGLPSLVYLWPAEGKSELYRVSLQPESEPQRIFESETGVLEYSATLDGSLLIYVSNRDGGGTELHALDMISRTDRLLIACEDETPCSAPAVSQDGTWLAFVQAEYSLGAAGRLLLSGTSVWLLNLETGAEPVQMSPADHSARNPGWSPTGWLMYFDDNLKAIALVDPGDGIPFNYIPSSLGILGSWSPDGTRLIYPELIFPDAPSADQTLLDADSPLYYSHLFMVDINSGRTLDVSPGGDWMVEDASPSFSPDGGLVAFTRKFLDPERWSPGRQVWLMSSDQAELIPLTAEPNALFSSLTWSPDSQQLAIMKKNLSDLGAPSEIWMVDIISGETSLIVEGGYLPEWLP